MRSFKYVGDPNDRFSGPDVINHHGISFRKGETVQIDDKDPANERAIQHLEGNSHFIDVSDKDLVKETEERRKALEKAEADRTAKAEARRKADEKDAAEREKQRQKHPSVSDAAVAPRPPGNVTREPVNDPFNGRTVEERTQAEDHTKAGKTKS